MKWYRILAAFILVMLLILAAIIAYVDINQKKILTQLQAELNRNINGELSIGKVTVTVLKDFPNLSITLNDGVLKDTVHHQEVFKAAKLYCQVNVFKMLFKKFDVHSVIVEGANIFLENDSSDHLNANMFKAGEHKFSGPIDIDLNLKKLKILDLALSFHDAKRNKHISVHAKDIIGNITKPDSTFDIVLKGFVHSDSMLFKTSKGSFLVNRDADIDIKLNLDVNKPRLTIRPSPIIVDEQKYTMDGYFGFEKQPAYLYLHIADSIVDFNKAKVVLPSQIYEKMKDITLRDPVDVNINIKGDIDPDYPPQVDARFKLRNNLIKAYGINISEVYLDGLFMNHMYPGWKNVDSNSQLIFSIPGAKVNGVPFNAQVVVSDLKALHVLAIAAANTDLRALNESIGADTVNYKFDGGHGQFQLAYKGTIYYYLDTIKRKFDDTLTGTLKVTDGSFEYAVRKLNLTNISTDISFSEKTVDFTNVSCLMNGNDLSLNGKVDNVRRVVTGHEERMVGNFKVYSKHFDLSKVLVMKKGFKMDALSQKANTAAAPDANNIIARITDMLNLNLNVKCDELNFRKLVAKEVKGDINASINGLELKNFGLNTCGGEIGLNGSFNTTQSNDHIETNASIKNLNVKTFLTAMENFDQRAVLDSNISGILNAAVHFATPLDSKYNVLADSMNARVYFSVTNGRLTNFAPLADVGKKIFRNRDFKNIAFAEIKDSIFITGKTIRFKRMEVASSVMRLFLQGKYSFNGLCDLSLQVPLSNLRKQDINYSPENIGVDAKAGASIFLRIHGNKDSVKITLDPMAKQRLKKEESLLR